MGSKLYYKKGGANNVNVKGSQQGAGYFDKIIRQDFKSTNSIIYLTILTIIMLMTLFYGFRTLSSLTADKRTKTLFTVMLLSTYIIFLGFYYLNWNLESIFVIILILSVLLGLVSFLIIYFGNSVCEDIEKDFGKDEKGRIKFLLIAAMFIVIYLGFHNKSNYDTWTLYDTIRFIIILIILRMMYYFVRKYDLQYYKTITDVITLVILYFSGRRMYALLNLPKMSPISIPTGLEGVNYKIPAKIGINVPSVLESVKY